MDAEVIMHLAGVESGYGELRILRGIDLDLKPGTVTAVIGANGAGKSTLLKTIAGVVKIDAGSLVFRGSDITNAGSRQRLELGIVLVPQGRCNFPLMTVRENLEMGGYILSSAQVQERLEEAYARFPLLREKQDVMAGSLSGGEQQLLEMSMAMMLSPSVMLVDEPSLGLSHLMQRKVFEAIGELRESGATILMVEQNAVQALEIADTGVVVELGRVSQTGSGVSMLDDENVRRAYLGLAT